jgi:hypothetical protein
LGWSIFHSRSNRSSHQENDYSKSKNDNEQLIGEFFESKSFYPPSNGADYFEYTLIAALNNKLNAVYWTDVSKEVPPNVENLPFILPYILKEVGF